MTKTTVTTIDIYHVVEGVIAVIGGKLVNEPYRRVHKTRAKALADAAKLDRENAEGLAELDQERAFRLGVARSYLSMRAARVRYAQLRLF